LVAAAFLLIVLFRAEVLTLLLLPGVAVFPLLELFPSALTEKIAYSIAPDGGPDAALVLVVGGSVVFWAAVLAVGYCVTTR
jgi:hypothetical protein